MERRDLEWGDFDSESLDLQTKSRDSQTGSRDRERDSVDRESRSADRRSESGCPETESRNRETESRAPRRSPAPQSEVPGLGDEISGPSAVVPLQGQHVQSRAPGAASPPHLVPAPADFSHSLREPMRGLWQRPRGRASRRGRHCWRFHSGRHPFSFSSTSSGLTPRLSHKRRKSASLQISH